MGPITTLARPRAKANATAPKPSISAPAIRPGIAPEAALSATPAIDKTTAAPADIAKPIIAAGTAFQSIPSNDDAASFSAIENATAPTPSIMAPAPRPIEAATTPPALICWPAFDRTTAAPTAIARATMPAATFMGPDDLITLYASTAANANTLMTGINDKAMIDSLKAALRISVTLIAAKPFIKLPKPLPNPPPLAIPLPIWAEPFSAPGLLATEPNIFPNALPIKPTILPITAPLSADNVATRNILLRATIRSALPILISCGLYFVNTVVARPFRALSSGGTSAINKPITAENRSPNIWPRPDFIGFGFFIASVILFTSVVIPLRATDIKPKNIPLRAFIILDPPSATSFAAPPCLPKNFPKVFLILSMNFSVAFFGSLLRSPKNVLKTFMVSPIRALNFLGSNMPARPPKNCLTPGNIFTNIIPTCLPAWKTTLSDFRIFFINKRNSLLFLIPSPNPERNASMKPLKPPPPPPFVIF